MRRGLQLPDHSVSIGVAQGFHECSRLTDWFIALLDDITNLKVTDRRFYCLILLKLYISPKSHNLKKQYYFII